MPLVNLIKSASFHGYLEAGSKVPFLGGPTFEQMTKHAPPPAQGKPGPSEQNGGQSKDPVRRAGCVLRNRAESLPSDKSAP